MEKARIRDRHLRSQKISSTIYGIFNVFLAREKMEISALAGTGSMRKWEPWRRQLPDILPPGNYLT
jgi:hypothetical protein